MSFFRPRAVEPIIGHHHLFALEVKGDPLFRELIGLGGWRSGGVHELGARIVRYLSVRTRAASVAISISHEEGESWTYCNVAEARIKRAIERSAALGAKFDNDSFPPFGFGGVAQARGLPGGRIFVWLGFAPSISPTALESQIAGEVARLAEEEMQYRARLHQVSGSDALFGPSRQNALAQFSHDIRSPLNNIKAILALLKLEELRPESAELLEVALSNCRGVEAIVEDVMDLSRFRAGKLARKRERIDLCALASEVVEGFAVSAKLKGLGLRIEGGGPALFADGDRNQIRRVLANLVCNGLKYTKFGEVVITLEAGSDCSVSAAVRDTGIGMSATEVATLFVPFTRLESAEAPGLGLGLSIAKMLAERNSGSLKVSSLPGKGSTFTLHLPASRGAARELTSSPAVTTSSSRILIADDDKDYVRSISKLFIRDGFKVEAAHTVHDAISILNFGGADIVLADVGMPHGGGRRILDAATRYKTPIPVIFVTGTEGIEHEARARGCAAVLNKPCDYTMLKSTVLEVLAPRLRAAGS